MDPSATIKIPKPSFISNDVLAQLKGSEFCLRMDAWFSIKQSPLGCAFSAGLVSCSSKPDSKAPTCAESSQERAGLSSDFVAGRRTALLLYSNTEVTSAINLAYVRRRVYFLRVSRTLFQAATPVKAAFSSTP
jgi:hypothetical protein